jgi:hypothetical protein
LCLESDIKRLITNSKKSADWSWALASFFCLLDPRSHLESTTLTEGTSRKDGDDEGLVIGRDIVPAIGGNRAGRVLGTESCQPVGHSDDLSPNPNKLSRLWDKEGKSDTYTRDGTCVIAEKHSTEGSESGSDWRRVVSETSLRKPNQPHTRRETRTSSWSRGLHWRRRIHLAY